MLVILTCVKHLIDVCINLHANFTFSVLMCRSVFGVWRLLLNESEKIGKARLASADVFQSRISENAKNTRQAKLAVAKKCFDALRKYQDEVQQVRSGSDGKNTRYTFPNAIHIVPCRISFTYNNVGTSHGNKEF